MKHVPLGRLFFVVVVLAVLLLMAGRAPAPIVESDNPTPAPAERLSAPKQKHSSKPNPQTTTTNKTPRQPSEMSGPARFSGTWSGKIQQGLLGTITVSFFINSEGTSVKMKEGERPAVVNGNTISWKSGWFNEVVWTLTPQGPNSAAVTSNSGLGVDGTATFTKTMSMSSSAPLSPSTTTQRPNPETANLPTAKQVPGKLGFVYNPFDSSRDAAVFDVRGHGHGAIVRDPASGKLFIVP